MRAPVRPTVYFHIGVPKSGTTYLQQTLHRNRTALRAVGMLYPGTGESHFVPCQDLLEGKVGDYQTRTPGAWARLVRQLERWPGSAVIDHELFCGAKQPVVDRALDDLGFADVHVVLTARDFARQLPAVWQTRLRTGADGSYAGFLEAVCSGPPGRKTSRPFWANQGIPAILERWGRTLPPDHIHVVTVPPPGSDPDLLWQRFAGVLRIDPAVFPGAPLGANTSLGAADAALLRRINEELADRKLPWPVYASLFKRRLAPALAGRGGPGIELPQDVYEWAVEWCEGVVDQLKNAGYDVAGDLADLIPHSRPTGADPDKVTTSDQLDAAVAGLVSMASLAAQTAAATEPPRRPRRSRLPRTMRAVARRVPARLRREPAR
ncbi:MAG TPA: hypothetical protein VE442_06210 [Jatrophihabitans sp.]|jgi:hypothetical protein|nr:hypothetical protein [Jatrophihabitans sp.]